MTLIVHSDLKSNKTNMQNLTASIWNLYFRICYSDHEAYTKENVGQNTD